MTLSRPGRRTVLVVALCLSLLGATTTLGTTDATATLGTTDATAASATTDAVTQPQEVDLTFETAPDGESWDDPTETDFGYLSFSVFTPTSDQERPAVAKRVPTPDDPPTSLTVITNLNADGEPGWLNVRFRSPQESPRLVFWLEPDDERFDEEGNSNELFIRGYDASNARVFERQSQLTAGGYVFVDVDPEADSDRVTRVAITARPPTGPAFSRLYVSRVSFTAAPPTVDLRVSPTAPAAGERPTVHADADPAAAITDLDWFVDGRRYVPPADRSGRRIITPELSAGTHTIAVDVTDRFGRQASAERTVSVRRAAPFPSTIVVLAAGGALVVLVIVGALVRRRRGRH